MKDWVEIVEAARTPAATDAAWADAIADAATKLLDSPLVGVVGIEHGPDCSDARLAFAKGALATEEFLQNAGFLQRLGARGLRETFYPDGLVHVMNEFQSRLTPESKGLIDYYFGLIGGKDAYGLLGNPEPGLALVVSAVLPRKASLSQLRRRLFTQVALHVETSLRARRRSGKELAVVSTSGKILHRVVDAPSSESLSAHVANVEQARKRRNRRLPEALDLWSALVAGHASLVERFEGAQRHYVFVENPPTAQPFRALTSGEVDAVSYAARGLSTKAVAYALGHSQSTISTRLAEAARKVGLSTRIELVRIAAMLTHDPRARFERIALTAAERDVLELLQQGLSNNDIARMRGRSIRTIANQVASLLRKTERPNRRALATGQ